MRSSGVEKNGWIEGKGKGSGQNGVEMRGKRKKQHSGKVIEREFKTGRSEMPNYNSSLPLFLSGQQ